MSGATSNLEALSTLNSENNLDLASRLDFLYHIIEDTQETVRFSIQHQSSRPALHYVLFALFMAVEVCSILVCLRVIFPTVKPHINNGVPARPRFYIAHNKAHHWILHTVSNPSDNILSESKISYFESLKQATDEHLMSSLADTVLTLAFIRQIKSDRLHAAMFCLIASVFLFAAIMLVS